MKKNLLGLALLLPFQAISANDSVYTWGHWSQGIKPAAGPAHIATPAPAKTPNVNFRPNENSVFYRSPQQRPPAAVVITPAPPVAIERPPAAPVPTSTPGGRF